ncbi:MAG: glutathione S-transferase N-terminal domain-containing protein [Polaromonas sp.]|jgi:GST-like protein|uniref:Glutathione S-transferase n=4 Tax=Sphingomonadales TaxID=204457 RepID=A0A0N9UWD9_SPHMC|nr:MULTISPECIES: glutathione binding-like protein [Sphingomonadales]MBK6368226.1 glutathione S-transferase N-terminal domain-containing protein [Polaromonas sp.]TXH01522.1 MAG: glutathione S-transferase [Rhodocyclaceae bacterium]ALH81274.1 glutathione S-transferase [Sphingopyxis macrogoltabida]AMU90211.1 glutathione S-transferase [Sphingopyxis macrogoltabida]AMU96619.1 glutathione S-transferase [Sphingopyxis terrae subsp. terrae NBRC 15098]|tara:strand:- start:952 stop:1638 length:687 start_codon:yes stop_codon:yes gene_type:complete
MIELFFWPTPNGYKATITLAELGLLDKVTPIDILSGEQFDPAYLELNPNNKVPTIIDHDGPGGKPVTIFESGAILLYLAEKTGKLLPKSEFKRLEAIQWLFFQVSSMGPMLGQTHHFRTYAPEKIEYAINRYTKEAERLYKILDNRLSDHDFLADEYSIADIATFTWVRPRKMQGQNLDDYPNVKRWYDTIKVRPAISEGLSVLSDNMKWNAKPGSKEWENMFSASKK